MSETERNFEIIMIMSVAKLLSDQSTYLQGEHLGPLKQEFKSMVWRTDDFIKKCERLFPDHTKTLECIADMMNDNMTLIRKQLQ